MSSFDIELIGFDAEQPTTTALATELGMSEFEVAKRIAQSPCILVRGLTEKQAEETFRRLRAIGTQLQLHTVMAGNPTTLPAPPPTPQIEDLSRTRIGMPPPSAPPLAVVTEASREADAPPVPTAARPSAPPSPPAAAVPPPPQAPHAPPAAQTPHAPAAPAESPQVAGLWGDLSVGPKQAATGPAGLPMPSLGGGFDGNSPAEQAQSLASLAEQAPDIEGLENARLAPQPGAADPYAQTAAAAGAHPLEPLQPLESHDAPFGAAGDPYTEGPDPLAGNAGGAGGGFGGLDVDAEAFAAVRDRNKPPPVTGGARPATGALRGRTGTPRMIPAAEKEIARTIDKGNYGKALMEAFTYPFQKDAIVPLIAVPLVAEILNFIPLVGGLLSLAVWVSYLFTVLRHSAGGAMTLPMTDDFQSFADLFQPLVRGLLAIFVPLLLLGILSAVIGEGIPDSMDTRSMPVLTLLVAATWLFFLPASLILAAHGSGCLGGLNYIAGVQLILREPGGYFLAILALIPALVLAFVTAAITTAMEQRLALPFVPGLVGGVLRFVPALIAPRILGVFMWYYEDELNIA